MGLVIPGMTPDTLGEIYEYFPSVNELLDLGRASSPSGSCSSP